MENRKSWVTSRSKSCRGNWMLRMKRTRRKFTFNWRRNQSTPMKSTSSGRVTIKFWKSLSSIWFQSKEELRSHKDHRGPLKDRKKVQGVLRRRRVSKWMRWTNNQCRRMRRIKFNKMSQRSKLFKSQKKGLKICANFPIMSFRLC